MLTGQLGFVTAAYAITAAVIVGLIVWVMIDRAKQKATLKKLEDACFTGRDAGKS